MTLGDRLIVMKDGYADQIGVPLDVYEKPQTRFVAGFIGSPAMNFFDAVLSKDGKKVLFPGVKGLDLPDGGLSGHGGRDVNLGIRPEHLQIADVGDSSIQLTVEHVETLGADTLIHGHLGDRNSHLSLRLYGVRQFDKNAVIPLEVSGNKLHLFEKETGRRL